MHVNNEMIKNAEFVIEQKPERTSFSVRFFDEKNERVLGCFFTKMYDENKMIKSERKNSTMIYMQNMGRKSSSNHILSVNYMESFEPLTKIYS